MNDPTLTCQNEQRRQEIRRRRLNGLDYLEVGDDQRSLCVHFLGPVPENITKENLRIEGGQRIRDIQVTDLQWEIQDDPTIDNCLRVFVNKPGDFFIYTLRLVKLELDAQGRWQPLDGFDSRYAQLKFSFKVGCPSDLDCKSDSDSVCPPEAQIEPDINYLAKDYASFRQLILDRLALTMPDWQERHVPDLGITLVEILAYVGDYLSYYQDAVATEAYLDTARQRISVRRHVRLVDYQMHEGCNARTWVWLETSQDIVNPPLNPQDFYFITRYPNAPASGAILISDDLRNIPAAQYEIFEPIFTEPQAKILLYKAHNEIHFYTWGDRQCCLPKKATTATLLDEWVAPPEPTPKPPESCDDDDSPPPPLQLERKLQLKEGDILIFEEVKGAKTGNRADADPTHRHAVRLTQVQRGVDALYTQKVENVNQDMATPIVEIAWAAADALPFPLCISGLRLAPDCDLIQDISVARGNVILVDHGRTIYPPEELGTVEEKKAIALCEGEGQPTNITAVPALFRPRLKQASLTFSQPLSAQDLTETSASELLIQNSRQALPQITTLIGLPPDYQEPIGPPNPSIPQRRWKPQLDLLSSNSQEQHFVVEIDNDGYAHLRFGNGEMGQQPTVGTSFFATYRIGNGIAGNIGTDTISHLVFRQSRQSGGTLQPHNPLPAKGGTSPEPLSEAKLLATHTFGKELQRAITAQDYADIVMRDFPTKVQRAAATLRWTGSWHEVLVLIDPLGTDIASVELLEAIANHLYRYRRIGHDLVVKQVVYVPLDIAMTVCVQADYLRGHIKAALLGLFSNRILPNGQRGFFHPDNLTFGVSVALSQMVATAQAVSGVQSITVTRLQRLNEGDNGELATGILSLSSLEVARLDNDPSFPENGKFLLTLRGGR